ncbi:hypothetical protein LIT38_05785 [Bacillus sp. CMF12]|uniref:hypothetical protein n=1 Tax=Bacillaceae TaxID=186817 RepID=UPI001FB4F0DA|nr:MULTISPECIES: hypothetical protein [Bacillaceae]UOE56476.1 hypothetical protein IRB79_06940 [Cytobacillus oceanisediminis]USK50969.1 hypothetical protein LIT38_05785 [Bacillus sp. CMF12]
MKPKTRKQREKWSPWGLHEAENQEAKRKMVAMRFMNRFIHPALLFLPLKQL